MQYLSLGLLKFCWHILLSCYHLNM